MKRLLLIIFMVLGLCLPSFAQGILPAVRGVVKSLEYVDIESVGTEHQVMQDVTVKVLSGAFKGEEIRIENMLTGNPSYDILLTRGDKVIMHAEPKGEFIAEVDDINFYIADIERVNSIYFFTGIFFALLLVIGRKKGLSSFVAIFATVALIFFAMTPMILNGVCPILAALLVCVLSTLITVYLVGGFNHKSTSAVLGTVLSLVLAAILSILAIKVGNLTGFAGEENMFLYAVRPDIEFTGILSACMMLAALGAVMDVGVSIASTINEIKETDSSLGFKALFTSGMNVGRDIIGTMSNTLILVYLGSSLPLVLLSSNIDLVKFFNLNQVATEILSALIGSIAILACVPITAAIAAWLVAKRG